MYSGTNQVSAILVPGFLQVDHEVFSLPHHTSHRPTFWKVFYAGRRNLNDYVDNNLKIKASEDDKIIPPLSTPTSYSTIPISILTSFPSSKMEKNLDVYRTLKDLVSPYGENRDRQHSAKMVRTYGAKLEAHKSPPSNV
jgi:hypothetical protein